MSRRVLAEIAAPLIGIGFAVAIRTVAVALFFIPSESMLPTLLPGDLVLVDKWAFRSHDRLPARGDVVMVRAPGSTRIVVKRVVGLPGESVAMRDGVPVLNGRPFLRWRVADLRVPVAPRTPCAPQPGLLIAREGDACRYRRYREAMPEGHLYDVIDLGPTRSDDRRAIRIPPGMLYLLGDNRDRSADSRVAAAEGGVGLVPVADVVGRPVLAIASTDGSARFASPASWWRSLRPARIGMRF